MAHESWGERVKLRSKWGRWTVLSYAPPAVRPGDRAKRPRVLVKCICGHEQLVWECDLKASRTGGCRSRRCRARWEAAQELVAHLYRLVGGGGGDGTGGGDD